MLEPEQGCCFLNKDYFSPRTYCTHIDNLIYYLEISEDPSYTTMNLHSQNLIKKSTKFIMKYREALLIDGAVASPLLGIRRSTAFHFVISYTVLIKTCWLSSLAGVSGVEGVWSLHVVRRQAGTY